MLRFGVAHVHTVNVDRARFFVLARKNIMCWISIASGFLYLTSLISIALCPSLTDPANGMVMWTGLNPGSTATYTCDEGFELNGVETRTCQSDGTWSDVPPTCDRT